MTSNKELNEKLKNIDLEKCKKDCGEYFKNFDDETDCPKRCSRDKLGQFICVGKLKEPTDHLGKGVNVVTIRSTHITDRGEVAYSRWDLRFDELIIFRDLCARVLFEWDK